MKILNKVKILQDQTILSQSFIWVLRDCSQNDVYRSKSLRIRWDLLWVWCRHRCKDCGWKQNWLVVFSFWRYSTLLYPSPSWNELRWSSQRANGRYNYHLDGQLTIGVMDSSNQNYLHHTVLLSKIWDLKERIILRTISLSHKFYHSFSDTRGEKPLHMVRYFTIRGDKKSHRVSEKLSGNYDDETK